MQTEIYILPEIIFQFKLWLLLNYQQKIISGLEILQTIYRIVLCPTRFFVNINRNSIIFFTNL